MIPANLQWSCGPVRTGRVESEAAGLGRRRIVAGGSTDQPRSAPVKTRHNIAERPDRRGHPPFRIVEPVVRMTVERVPADLARQRLPVGLIDEMVYARG